jgi:hypothetical protein
MGFGNNCGHRRCRPRVIDIQLFLGLLCDRRWSGNRYCSNRNWSLTSTSSHTIDFVGLRAVLGDMADLAASVASLGARISQWSSVWCGTVSRDVSEFAASVALHGLGLTIASIVIRTAAFVASCRSRNTAISTTESSISTTCSTAYGTTRCGSWAVAGNVASLTAGIAATRRST